MIATKKRGRINLNKEMPEDFMATSSKFSPSLPKVIIEDSKMAIVMKRRETREEQVMSL